MLVYNALEAINRKMTLFHTELKNHILYCEMKNKTELVCSLELAYYMSIYDASGEPIYFEKFLTVLSKIRSLPPSPITITAITNGLIYAYRNFSCFSDSSTSSFVVENYVNNHKSEYPTLSDNSTPVKLLNIFISQYKEWISLSINLYGKMNYDYFTYLGAVYFAFRDYKNALKNFKKAAEYRICQSDKVEVSMNLCICYYSLNKKERSLYYLNKALIQIDDNDPRINNLYLNAWEIIKTEYESEFAKSYLGKVNFKAYLQLSAGYSHLTEMVFDEFLKLQNCYLLENFLSEVVELYANEHLDFRRYEWITNYISNFFKENNDKELIDLFKLSISNLYTKSKNSVEKFLLEDCLSQCPLNKENSI